MGAAWSEIPWSGDSGNDTFPKVNADALTFDGDPKPPMRGDTSLSEIGDGVLFLMVTPVRGDESAGDFGAAGEWV